MRKDINVAAQSRDTRGKNEARRLRVAKLSPAIIYGAGKDPVSVSLSAKDLEKILNSKSGHNTIFNLDIQDGETTAVMIKATQRDPVKDHLLHADLLRIDLTKPITVGIPVHLRGEPAGVKLQGGLLEVITREIEVECLPEDILDELVENISELMVGQSLRAGEVKLPGSMKLMSPADQVVAHVIGKKEEAVVAADAVATVEPELAKKGKKDEVAAPAAAEKKPAEKGKKK